MRDDKVILMNLPPVGEVATVTADNVPVNMNYVAMTVDQMKELRDVGVKTSYEFVQWHIAEQEPGQYNWELLDRQVERCREAGLKAMLATPNTIPVWIPDEWRAHTMDTPCDHNPYNAYISLWSDNGQDYMRGFVGRVLERYASPDVLIISSFQKDGEGPMAAWEMGGFYDSDAMASFTSKYGQGSLPLIGSPKTLEWFRDAVVARYVQVSEMLVNQTGEIWCQIHRELAQYPGTGCQFAGEVYAALKAIPGAHLHALQFTYFPFRSRAYPRVKSDMEAYGIPFWVGGEWSDGARINAPQAVADGISGFITAPIHPYTSSVFTKQMVDDIAAAIKTFGG